MNNSPIQSPESYKDYDVPQRFNKSDLVRINSNGNRLFEGALGIVIVVSPYEGSRYRTYEVYIQKHGKLLLRHTEFGHVFQKGTK